MHIEGITIDQMVDIMIRFQITAKQFLLLFILEVDKEETHGLIGVSSKKAISNVYKIAEKHVDSWNLNDIDDLIAKGLVHDHNPAGGERDIYPDNLVVADIFIDAVMSSLSHFEEFWQLYPGFCDNFDDFRGPKIPLKACVYEDVETLYRKYVRTKQKHLQVMKVLAWGIEHDMVKMRVDKYVGSRMWDQHLELKLTESHNPMSKTIV